MAMSRATVSRSQSWQPIAAVAAAIDEGVTVVAVFDLGEFGDDVGLGDEEPEADAGEAVGLAQGSGDEDAFVLPDQVEAIRFGEVDVGLVDDEWAGE